MENITAVEVTEISPKAEKKVVAKKAPVAVEVETISEVTESVKETAVKLTSAVGDAAKSSIDAVKETATKVSTSVTDAAKSGMTSVKETVTKVSASVTDAAKSGMTSVKETVTTATDSVKDTFSTIETTINDSRAAGNSRAKKIVAALFDDNVNETVNNFIGHMGEATAVCATVMCSPITVSANQANTLYKKITA